MFGPALRRRTFAAALRDVGEKSIAVRASALSDLTVYVDENRVRVLGALEAALSDEAPAVRARAATALADVHGAEALSSLLFAVEDEDPYVRQMAIAAVGEIGDPRAQQRLRRALSDARPEVRFQAVIAFVRVAPEESDEAIVQALRDTDPSIRHIAVRMAEEHAEQRGAPIANEVRAAIRALLQDTSSQVRVVAAVALARAGDRAGEAILSDVVAGRVTTHEAEDEAMAVELAGEMRLAGVEKELERRAFGLRRFRAETFSWQATVALARMGHARAITRIVGDLRSWSRDRRTLAVAAAGRARLHAARELIESMRGDEARAEQDAVATALGQLVVEATSEPREAS